MIIRSALFASLLLTTQLSFGATINRVEFKDANIRDAARILATLSGANIAVTKEASNATVDLLLQDIELKHAVEMISRVSGLWYRYSKSNNSYLIMTEKQYQDDIVIYRDDIIRTFTLKHQNVKATALTIQSLFGDRVILKLQEDLDDFRGIPSGYLQSINDLTSSSGSGDNNNRVSITNINNKGGNSNYSGENSGEITTIQREEDNHSLINQKNDSSQLSISQLRQLDSAEVNADGTLSKKSGIKTPIFIATNRIHNLMFIRTSDEQAMSDIENLIRKSDKPTPQVLLETKILRIDQGDSFNQDFDISYNSALNLPDASFASGTTLNDVLNSNATINVSDMSVNTLSQLAQQATGIGVTKTGFNSVTGGFYEYYSRYLNAKVELLEAQNKAEIIAKPILLASNNRPSRLFIGEDQVVATGLSGGSTTSSNNGNTSVTTTTDTELETEVRKIGNTLALLPSVNEDGTVTIDILQSTSELKKQGMNFPFFNPKTGLIDSVALDTVEESSIKTIVVAKDGHTIALGGMMNQIDSDKKSTVPVLGNIPVLGELFRKKETVQSNGQYIMLITPHVIATPEEAAKKSREIEEVDFRRHGEDSALTDDQLPVTSTDALLRLNRYAARRVHDQAATDPTIREMPAQAINVPVDLLGSHISVWPVASYYQHGVYLTVVRAQNMKQQTLALNLAGVPGRWLSIAKSKNHLGPYTDQRTQTGAISGLPSDTDYLYFASRTPFTLAYKK